MPEFHGLDNFFTIPLYLQITFFIFSIISGLLLFRKSLNIKILIVFIFVIPLTLVSGYKVVISNNLNSIAVSLDPFYNKEIKFDSITSIKYSGSRILINTKSDSYNIYTGWYPFGIDKSMFKTTLSNFGNCIDEVEGQCMEIKFTWP